MSDQQQSGVVIFLHPLQHVQHLSLNGHIQRSSGFVCDDQLRIAGKCHGDQNTLPQTAAELMREGVVSSGRFRNAHQLQSFNGAGLCLFFGNVLLGEEHFLDLPANGHDRVQRTHGILEDHRDLLAADILHFLVGIILQFLAAHTQLIHADQGRRGIEQLHDSKAGHTFAAAAYVAKGTFEIQQAMLCSVVLTTTELTANGAAVTEIPAELATVSAPVAESGINAELLFDLDDAAVLGFQLTKG